jgi:hypothetical protein
MNFAFSPKSMDDRRYINTTILGPPLEASPKQLQQISAFLKNKKFGEFFFLNVFCAQPWMCLIT